MAAKINMEIARKIRKDFLDRYPRVAAKEILVQGLQKELAVEHGIGMRTVQSILTGRSWREKNL